MSNPTRPIEREQTHLKSTTVLTSTAKRLGLKVLTITLLSIVGGFSVYPAQAQDYDVVILNGRVMDPETKLDAVRHVGITDGIIAAITEEKIAGK
jgi:hypothetical protein